MFPPSILFDLSVKICRSQSQSEEYKNISKIFFLVESLFPVVQGWQKIFCSPALSEEERSKRRRNKKERGGSLFSLRWSTHFEMSSIPLICRTTLVIKEEETRNEGYFFCRNKRTFDSISFCRKKKDKKDGAKGLAKAGSAVSLQVRIGTFLLFHDCLDPYRPKRTQTTKC